MSEMDLDRTKDKDYWIAEYQQRIKHLQTELEKERKYVKCSVLCRCEDPYSPSRKQAARDVIDMITNKDEYLWRNFIEAIKGKFGLEI